MYKYLIITIVFALVIGIFFGSAFFEISEVIIRGYDQNDIDIEENILGENIFIVELETIKERLKNDPYIESVDSSKSFPDKIIFQVNYNRPVAAVINNDNFIIFNKFNKIIAENIAENRYDLPVFKNTPYYFKKDRITFPDRQNRVLNKLDILPVELRKKIKAIHFDPVGISLSMKEGYNIRIGSPENLEDKFIILLSAWNERMLDDADIEYVDITAPERPVIKK
ncbi:MAG: cell division protein FtsQ/DivIB [Halarsenatibacteraceae bacterium]